MIRFARFSALVGARPRHCPRHCPPSEHLVTVVRTRRLRDGLGNRYWIRCRLCDLEQGPYTDWQAAWLAAWRAQIATRRSATGGALPSRRALNTTTGGP
jgi:hypothetical protein